MCRSVIRSHCEGELGLSWWRLVQDLSAGDCVRVCGNAFECAELIEYSVSRLRVCVLRLCCAANAAPIEGLTQTQQQPHRRKQRMELNEKKG